jgi:pantoate--beta-alanine ligase
VKIVTSPQEMKNISLTYQRGGKTIGFVPTMGALHAGHLSLLEVSKKQADISVMSIFVNPVQFGPKEDFKQYPRPFNDDCAKAETAGCEIVFAPSVEAMYPEHYNTYVSVDKITDRLCGASRPGHFRGVTTIVLKLFNIINPQVAVFGQKDAQQVLVIKRMVKDLDMSVRIEVAPIIREPDGLAMSSRNTYLTVSERRDAPLIYAGLKEAKAAYDQGERDAGRLHEILSKKYSESGLFKPEYIEIVDTIEFQPQKTMQGTSLIAVAFRTRESNTRLIDNIITGGCV